MDQQESSLRGEDGQESSSSGITRISKACDPCRTRKTRCDIATQSVCSECLKRDQAGSCTIRDKARPNRPLPKSTTKPKAGDKRARSPSEGFAFSPPAPPPPPGTSYNNPFAEPVQAGPSRHVTFQPIAGGSGSSSFGGMGGSRAGKSMEAPSRPASGPLTVESILEEEALARYGLKLDVALSPENIFESVQITRHSLQEIGLSPGDPNAVKQAHHWINTHFRAIHHNTPFLSLPDVLETATKVLSAPNGIPARQGVGSVGHDELALMYAILALGSLREQTYDSQAKKYRAFRSTIGFDDTVADASPSSNISLPSYRSRSTAQCLFRLASDELEAIDRPSETAVQALFVLHTFISNTSMGRRSRDYVARAIMMAHELGLNRRIPYDLDLAPSKRTKYDKRATRRRAMLYLYVYFSDVYLSALDSHPPLIKVQDYDPEIFDAVYQSSSSGVDTPSGTPLNGLKAFVDLVTTIGSILERLHVSTSSAMTRIELVLRLESEIDSLRERLGTQTFNVDLSESGSNDGVKRNTVAGAILRQIHYNWSRIALRAPFLRDPLLRHSSLSICARSAMSILTFHRHVVSAALLNLPWMQLRRMATSIYLVFIAHWHGEITQTECETAVNCALEVLCVIGTRWQSAAKVGQVVVQLADKMGLSYRKPVREDPPLPQPETDLAQLAALATSTTDLSSVTIATDPLNLSDWSFASLSQGQTNDLYDPLSQFMDMDTIRAFNAELAGMGVSPDMLGWQHALHQPPW